MYLICGEALFDLFMDEALEDGTIKFDARVGGSPFNVAIGMARLGTQSGLFTGISTDFFGTALAKRLSQENVNIEHLIRSGRRTTLSVVGLDETGSPDYAFYGIGSADCSITQDMLPKLDNTISGLHFGSYSCVVDPAASSLFTLAKSAKAKGIFISYDPNVRLNVEPDVRIWQKRVQDFALHSDLIKISLEDFELLYPEQTIIDKAAEWLQAGVQMVIMTAGAQEVLAFTKDHQVKITPKRAQNIIDTVGAGDSFQAALLGQLSALNCLDNKQLSNFDAEKIEELLKTASAAATLTCTRRGADLPNMQDIQTFMEG